MLRRILSMNPRAQGGILLLPIVMGCVGLVLMITSFEKGIPQLDESTLLVGKAIAFTDTNLGFGVVGAATMICLVIAILGMWFTRSASYKQQRTVH